MKTSFAIFAELHLKEKLEKITEKLRKEEPAHLSYGHFRQIISFYGFSKKDTKQILAILEHQKILSLTQTQIFNNSKPFSLHSHSAEAPIFSLNPETRVLGKSHTIREADNGGRHG